MPEMSLASAATISACLAFILAAGIGITTRRGMGLMLIGIVLSSMPDINRVASGFSAGERARSSHEQYEFGRAQSSDHRP